jgi:major membrane immunogen (membrane-anchored lipoprotein)
MKYFNIINMLCISALLGACGGSSDSSPPVGDAFTNQVSDITNAVNDVAESQDISELVATQPEDTEPAPLS